MYLSRRLLPRIASGCLLSSLVAACMVAQAQEVTSGQPRRLPAGRIKVHTPPVQEEFELAQPETVRRSHRPVRSASVGFVPKHENVIGAQYLEDPMTETLPAPTPSRMTGPTPGMNAPATPLPGRRFRSGEIVGRGAPIMSEQFEGESYMGGEMGEMPLGGNPFRGGCSNCGGGNCGGGDCGPECGQAGCYRDCFPCLFFNFQNLEIFSGVHGFTNPTNRGAREASATR